MTGKHHYSGSIVHRGLIDDLTTFAELEGRIAALSSTRERGEAFEAFAEAYLATQKIAQAEHIWPDKHVPVEVLKALKLPSRDLGADGVFRTWSGALNAYQVKFRTGRPSLTWDELATFMGLSFAEAARRGIICDYKVIISVVTSQMLNDELLRHGEVIVEGAPPRGRRPDRGIELQASSAR